MRRLYSAAAVAALFLTVVGLSHPAGAEQARREKTSRHFSFHYHSGQEKLVVRLSKLAEQVRASHCRLLKPCFDGSITVRVAGDEEEFLDLQPHRAHIDWAAGVAYADLSLIILRIDKAMMLTLEETLEHEISHILLLKVVKKRPPRWFIEGLAILQARQNLIERFETVASAQVSGGPFALDEISESFPASASGRSLAYAQSGLFVSFLLNRYGEVKFKRFLHALTWSTDFNHAVRKVYGAPLVTLEAEWTDTLSSLSWLGTVTSDWMLWLFLTALFLVAFVVRRSRNKRRKRQMEEEERDWEFVD